ncbi:MAG: hypothetical protein ACI8S6_002201 [Myxococcota bacterium]|jgi:hypothetical protein
MHNNVHFEADAPSRKLLRLLRIQPDQRVETENLLPESVLWRIYCELRVRGEEKADTHFLRSLNRLLRRRSMTGIALPMLDLNPDEHKLVDDPMLSELWRAYKRCICSGRTGPAAQLLRDIEECLA